MSLLKKQQYNLVLHLLCNVISISILLSQNNVKQYSFKNLTVNQGLSQNSVVSIAQDSIGYIWFATQDGLNKYNGKQFEIYDKQFEDITRPNYSYLGKIYKDNFGDFWTYSLSNTIERLNYNKEVFDTLISIPSVTKLYRVSKQKLWLGTKDRGLIEFNLISKKITPLFLEKLKNVSVYTILKQENDIYYIGTSKGLFYIKNNTLKHVASTVDMRISSLQIFNQFLVLGTHGNGVNFYNLNTLTKSNFLEHLFPNNLNVQDMLVDSKLRLWVATYGKGLYLKESNSIQIHHFTHEKNNPFSIHYNDILTVFEDNSGVIWFGTDGQGLSYYDETLTKFNGLKKNQTLPNVHIDVVRSIAVSNTNIWLGTSGKGLTRINKKTTNLAQTFTTTNSGLASNRIMSLLLENDRLWIGHQGKGLQYLQNNTYYNISALKNKTVWKISSDTNENVWITTRNSGVYKLNKHGKIIANWDQKNSNILTNNIRTLEFNKDENIVYLGSESNGLFILNQSKNLITKYYAVDSPIKSLLYHSDLLYIGTNGNGLKILDTKLNQIKDITTENGLKNNVIYGILMDKKNNLWVSTNKGISKIENQTAIPKITNYTNYDGLQSSEFNTGAYTKSNDGILYFGGLDGINWFNPLQIKQNAIKPKTVISKVQLFNKTISSSKKMFNYNENAFTFHFNSLQFSQSERNLYKYRLVPYNKDWIYNTNLNIANYTNLEPNNYTFYVTSSNYDGVWSNKIAKHTFTIKKPWYGTNLAYLCCILLILLILYAIYSYFNNKWKLETKLQLEHAETNRLKQLDEFKSTLFENISHELRTPLTVIQGLSSYLTNAKNLELKQKQSLLTIERNSKQLKHLTQQILELKAIDAKQVKLFYKNGDIVKFIKTYTSFFKNYTNANQQKLLFKSNCESLFMDFDLEKLQTILNNLISNAIKFTPNEGEIFIELVKKDNQLQIIVKDTGVGISKENLAHIFDRHYTSKDINGLKGNGIGMALTKELVNILKGTIDVQSTVNKGTKFTVSLPIKKSLKPIDDFNFTPPFVQINSKELETNNIVNIQYKPTILVVEDNIDVQDYLQKLLGNSYAIITAKNGKDGLLQLKKHSVNFIISDIMMPIMDGYAFCEAVKLNISTSHIPFILLSAKAELVDKTKGLNLGIDAYLTKPFNTDELKLIIKNLLNKQTQKINYFSSLLDLKSAHTQQIKIEQIDIDFIKTIQEFALAQKTGSVNEIMNKLGVSRSTLHNKLKGLTGQSITEYINHIKIEKAKNLLKDTTLNISEIAYEVGFEDPAYFTRIFKKLTKKSPTAFKKIR